MAHIERLDNGVIDADRDLYILECDSFADIFPAATTLPGDHFVTLLIANFALTTVDDLVSLSSHLIAAGSRYFCAWGPECKKAHLAFDLACCEFEAGNDSVILTTDHADESLDDAIWFALNCAVPAEPFDRDWRAIISICVNHKPAGQSVRRAFADPVEFSKNNGPEVD
ncbi:hypothetical protein AB1K70_14215 [Bremerella sp. JC770]|uniref:DUF7684 family protein n=1 Tax=Bremerella sp. JC770 TaxID=3232137 RepID=UPI00345B2C96